MVAAEKQHALSTSSAWKPAPVMSFPDDRLHLARRSKADSGNNTDDRLRDLEDARESRRIRMELHRLAGLWRKRFAGQEFLG